MHQVCISLNQMLLLLWKPSAVCSLSHPEKKQKEGEVEHVAEMRDGRIRSDGQVRPVAEAPTYVTQAERSRGGQL